jgi:hypothetical protein
VDKDRLGDAIQLGHGCAVSFGVALVNGFPAGYANEKFIGDLPVQEREDMLQIRHLAYPQHTFPLKREVYNSLLFKVQLHNTIATIMLD